MDHLSIYLLIAGTYTPITLIPMRGPWGWTLFGLIWAMAISGIVAKAFLTGKYNLISILIYIAMGWLVLIAMKPLIRMVPHGMIVWLFIGGVCYTLGVVFYAIKKVPYFHFVWHLFVLGGSISHFFGMLFYLIHK
jgi:hemolysin III